VSLTLGFAGTWRGMTDPQRSAFAAWVADTPVAAFHCCGCVGADTQAVEAVCRAHPGVRLVVHPLKDERILSALLLAVADRREQPVPDRRSAPMVDAVDLIVLTPRSNADTRGGTVGVFRYAKYRRKPILIFWSDGSTEWVKPARGPAPRRSITT
jgi:hypothetical protein